MLKKHIPPHPVTEHESIHSSQPNPPPPSQKAILSSSHPPLPDRPFFLPTDDQSELEISLFSSLDHLFVYPSLPADILQHFVSLRDRKLTNLSVISTQTAVQLTELIVPREWRGKAMATWEQAVCCLECF
ncbi:hypothetical protein AAMO2058_001477100 [Amorphochlora amoebiformis]